MASFTFLLSRPRERTQIDRAARAHMTESRRDFRLLHNLYYFLAPSDHLHLAAEPWIPYHDILVWRHNGTSKEFKELPTSVQYRKC